MTVNVRIYKGQKPTEEQRMEIREAAKREPIYDEDAPELSVEQMQRYRKAAIDKKSKTAVTLELSKENMDKAHSFGKEYRTVLSRLLELAMDDKDLIKKAQI
ncbi:MAG: antitoxin [Lachnospiraceae bacterium]|nr:antitoxin [Lachnospiraceae bacterium]